LLEVSTGFSDSMPDYGGTTSSSTALEAALKILDIFIIALKCRVLDKYVIHKKKTLSKMKKKSKNKILDNWTTSRIRKFQKLKRVKSTAIFYANARKDEIPVGESATYPSCCRIPSLNIAVLYLLN